MPDWTARRKRCAWPLLQLAWMVAGRRASPKQSHQPVEGAGGLKKPTKRKIAFRDPVKARQPYLSFLRISSGRIHEYARLVLACVPAATAEASAGVASAAP